MKEIKRVEVLKSKTSTSSYEGIFLDKKSGLYIAYIKTNSTRYSLGGFENEDDANDLRTYAIKYLDLHKGMTNRKFVRGIKFLYEINQNYNIDITNKGNNMEVVSKKGSTRDSFTIEINHVDGDTTNNNLDNLELVTSHEVEVLKGKGFKSKFVGVSFDKLTYKYMVYVKMPKRNLQLGSFHTIEEARTQRINAMSNLSRYNGSVSDFMELLKGIN